MVNLPEPKRIKVICAFPGCGVRLVPTLNRTIGWKHDQAKQPDHRPDPMNSGETE